MPDEQETMWERIIRIYGPPTANSRKPDPDFEALMSKPYSYFEEHDGKYALMHDREIVELFNTFKEAITKGDKEYTRGNFTVQAIRTEPVLMGGNYNPSPALQ